MVGNCFKFFNVPQPVTTREKKKLSVKNHPPGYKNISLLSKDILSLTKRKNCENTRRLLRLLVKPNTFPFLLNE